MKKGWLILLFSLFLISLVHAQQLCQSDSDCKIYLGKNPAGQDMRLGYIEGTICDNGVCKFPICGSTLTYNTLPSNFPNQYSWLSCSCYVDGECGFYEYGSTGRCIPWSYDPDYPNLCSDCTSAYGFYNLPMDNSLGLQCGEANCASSYVHIYCSNGTQIDSSGVKCSSSGESKSNLWGDPGMLVGCYDCSEGLNPEMITKNNNQTCGGSLSLYNPIQDEVKYCNSGDCGWCPASGLRILYDYYGSTDCVGPFLTSLGGNCKAGILMKCNPLQKSVNVSDLRAICANASANPKQNIFPRDLKATNPCIACNVNPNPVNSNGSFQYNYYYLEDNMTNDGNPCPLNLGNPDNLNGICDNGVCSQALCTGNDLNNCTNKSFSQNYCIGNNVTRDNLFPICINGICGTDNKTEVLEECTNGCSNGTCINSSYCGDGTCDIPLASPASESWISEIWSWISSLFGFQAITSPPYFESCSTCPEDCGQCCVPGSCQSLGKQCGTWNDGCEENLICGDNGNCSLGTCNSTGQCNLECIPGTLQNNTDCSVCNSIGTGYFLNNSLCDSGICNPNGSCEPQSITCYNNSQCLPEIGNAVCNGNNSCLNITNFVCDNLGTDNSTCRISGIGLEKCTICQNGCVDGYCSQSNETNRNNGTCNLSCAGKMCGDDGCGGSCGSCNSGICNNGNCEENNGGDGDGDGDGGGGNENCRNCSGTCTNGVCISNVNSGSNSISGSKSKLITCLDNCSSLNYSCGEHLICGVEKNCGTCLETPQKNSINWWWLLLFPLILLILLLARPIKLDVIKIRITKGKIKSIDIACRKDDKLLGMGNIPIKDSKIEQRIKNIMNKKSENKKIMAVNINYEKIQKNSKVNAGYCFIKPRIGYILKVKDINSVSSIKRIERRFKLQEFLHNLFKKKQTKHKNVKSDRV